MTDQERLEKVIGGLECCYEFFRPCGECPYMDDDGLCGATVPNGMVGDALEILRALRPRVLTVAELEALPDNNEHTAPVCIEQRCPLGEWTTSTCKWVGAGFAIESYLDLDNIYYNRRTYGSTWRAWTAWPTTMQRAAVKWEE